jgi:N-acetylglucosaminyldiphosphoundecaprenol N-acetyl-beta-D-mannosaminyltransferase
MLRFCTASSAKKNHHFFYVVAQGAGEDLTRKFVKLIPRFQVVGTYCSPFRPLAATENEEAVAVTERSNDEIVWVGLGAPKPERRMFSRC